MINHTEIKAKTAEILEQGKAERGNFEPTGVPLRIYNYWLRKSRSDKADAIRSGRRRENFCHFWRVVVIWAGLLAAGRSFERFITSKAGAVIAGLLLLASVGVILTNTGVLVPALIIAGASVAVAAVLIGIGFLIQRYWNHDWDDNVGKTLTAIFVVAVAVYFVSLLVIGIMEFGWIVLLYVLGGLALFGGFIFGMATIIEGISGKRRIAREQAQREKWDYFYEHGHFPTPEPVEPGRVSKFFSGVADFLILVTQIVRVKKWKVCPMVDIKQ